MKFGFRRPSLRKRIAALTSWKRVVRHSLGLKAPRGMGWLTNPRKAAYNRVYNRTTKGCLVLLLALPCSTLLAVAFLLLLLTMSSYANGIIATLKSSSIVECRDARTGAFKRLISVNNAIDVGCDGETIAVLQGNGLVYRYDAQTGAFRGSISVSGKPTAVQVTGGVIVVTSGRTVTRYDARTGAFIGSSAH